MGGRGGRGRERERERMMMAVGYLDPALPEGAHELLS